MNTSLPEKRPKVHFWRPLWVLASCLLLPWLLGTRCQPSPHIHLRRHLAWCIGQTKPTQTKRSKGEKKAKKQPPSPPWFRLELELQWVDGEAPQLYSHWVRLFGTQATKQRWRLPKEKHLKQLLRQPTPKLSAFVLRHTPYKLWAQQCRALIEKRPFKTSEKALLSVTHSSVTNKPPKGRVRSFSWGKLVWRDPTKRAAQALSTWRHKLPLPTLEKLGLGFRKRYAKETYKDVLLMTLPGTPHVWPIHSDIPMPQRARVGFLDCIEEVCMVELAYGQLRQSANAPYSNMLLTFRPKKLAARVIHLRGYQRHEQKRYKEAVKDFSWAARLDPTYTDASYNQACAHALQGQLAPAAKLLKQLFRHKTSYQVLACKDTDLKLLHKSKRYEALFPCLHQKKPKTPKAPPPKTQKATSTK